MQNDVVVGPVWKSDWLFHISYSSLTVALKNSVLALTLLL